MEKNSFWQKFLAFLLSILVVALILPTIFTVPLEFLIMNGSTYSDLSTNTKLLDAGQDAFSEYIAAQLSITGENESVPPLFTNKEVLIEGIKPFITQNWLSTTLSDASSQLISFFNFKQPFGIVKIDLTEIKDNVLAGREEFVDNILGASAPCSTDEIMQLSSASLSIQKVPLCNPPVEMKDKVVAAVSDYVESFLYKIPNEYQVNFEEGIQSNLSNPILSYSLVRWLFRILPVVWLLLLVLIGICLRKNKSEMRTWIGRLITIASAICLVLILILLIGSEQFTALFINQTLSSENSAFGTLVLIALQAITYRALIWMGIIAAGFFLAGFLILFFNKWNIQRKIAAEKKQEELQYQKTAQELLEAKQALAESVVEEKPVQEEQAAVQPEEPKEEKKKEAEVKKPTKKAARKTKKKEG